MRKAYGPTGVSFHYPLDQFKADIAGVEDIHVELVLAGNAYKALVSAKMTDSEAKAFFDSADCMSLQNGDKVFTIFG